MRESCRASSGLTLLEMLVVIVILAIIATISIPMLLGSKISANETAAYVTVRAVVQAQLDFAERREADLNRNGQGEFGTFGEMSGNIAVRASSGGTRYLEPSVVNPSFRLISPLGEMFRHGYYYRIYLPDGAGFGVTELPGGGAAINVDPDLAEATWCIYAWPQRYGATGRRTFFANQTGDVLFTDNPAYSGPGAPIPPGAALAAGPANSIQGPLATNAVGRDGSIWRAVGTN